MLIHNTALYFRAMLTVVYYLYYSITPFVTNSTVLLLRTTILLTKEVRFDPPTADHAFSPTQSTQN